MQSLASFFEDNKLLAYATVAAAVVVLLFVVFVLYRLLFGRRLRAASNGRARQPRLGIVDAYDLDRQRQLVLVRRDNVEHLIMIGGPTDVVVESSIVRTQSAAMPRDKDGAGPMVGSVTPPAGVAASPAALPPATAPAARTEPTLAGRNGPAARGEAPAAVRTEPSLGPATPMTSPAVDRPPPERGGLRPIAVPDPAAPSPPAQQAARSPVPRPSSLPPRPTTPGPQVEPMQSPASSSGAVPQGAGPAPERPAGIPRPPLPARPPLPRPPLPPRPSLASSLPPRPARSLPTRPEPARDEPPRADPAGAPDLPGATGPDAEPDTRARGPEAPVRRVEPPAGAPKNIETLESLEEEMAKLLGRPAPRRDG